MPDWNWSMWVTFLLIVTPAAMGGTVAEWCSRRRK